jgi:putative sterol carrier protein
MVSNDGIAALAERVRQRFAAADPIESVIRFDLGREGRFVVDGSTLPPALAAEGTAVDFTLTVDRKTLEQLLDGKQTPTGAYFAGRIKSDGPMASLMRLADLFGED